jgi:hypothetical protein
MMTMFGKTALITSRDPKGQQATAVFEAAYNKAKLDDGRAQRLNEHGNELKAGIAKLIAELSVTDRFKDEEARSSYGYLSGYKPQPIADQIARLCELFPGIGGYAENADGHALADGAEGWFAIPRWDKIAPTYGEAVQKVLDLIKQTRNGKFYNYREGQLGPDRLKQSDRTVAAFEKFGEDQGDDILIIPAQFGIRHRGRSVRRAREVFVGNEFGLGAFAIGIMLLTHPERLQNVDDLWIDCSGDEYAPGADGGFSGAPIFSFRGGEVEFGGRWLDSADGRCGSASGFVPQ